MTLLVAAVLFSVFAVLVTRRPFWGLLSMILVNPFEALVSLPSGITAGRTVGLLAMVGWIVQLSRDRDSARRLVESPLTRVIWVFPASCLVGTIVCTLVSGKLGGFELVITVSLLAIMATMIDNMAFNRRRIDQVLLAVIISSAVAAIFPFAYHFGLDLYSAVGVDASTTLSLNERVQGLTNNANALGLASNMGLMALLVFASTRKRAKGRITAMGLLAALSVAMLFSLILSGSRTHIVAFAVFVALLLSLRLITPVKGRIFALVALLAIIAVLPFVYKATPSEIRERVLVDGRVSEDAETRYDFTLGQMRQSLDYVSSNPLFGVGMGGFRVTADNGMDPHDTFSALVGETGMVGTLAFLWLLTAAIRRLVGGVICGRRCLNPQLYWYSSGFLAWFLATLASGYGGAVIFHQRSFWMVVGVSAVVDRWVREQQDELGPEPSLAWSTDDSPETNPV